MAKEVLAARLAALFKAVNVDGSGCVTRAELRAKLEADAELQERRDDEAVLEPIERRPPRRGDAAVLRGANEAGEPCPTATWMEARRGAVHREGWGARA